MRTLRTLRTILRRLLIQRTLLFNLLRTLLFQVSEGASGQQALPQSTSRHSNMSSVADVTESWEFRSALEAPIATLESLDEIDRQVNKIESFNLSREIILSKLDKIENWAKLRNRQKFEKSTKLKLDKN